MTTVLASHPRPANGCYGPTPRGNFYLSVEYHRKTAASMNGKSRWVLPEGQEFSVFCMADAGWWYCATSSCLFAVVDKAVMLLGQDGQRLAVFLPPQNSADPYHGFPIFSGDKKPDPDLLDVWVAQGVIDHAVRMKIERGRL